MVKSMYAAVAGLRTHQAKMDVIGNNIANVNTFAFKKARATFRDQFYATMNASSEAGNIYGGRNTSQVGYGSSLSSIEVDFGTASGAPTGNGMDVMIAGQGFFMVGGFTAGGKATMSNFDALYAADAFGDLFPDTDFELPNLTSLNFTRVGIFATDGQGWLVDTLGNHVFGYEYRAGEGDNDPAVLDKTRLHALAIPWCFYDSNGKPIQTPTGSTVRVEWLMSEDDASAYDIELEHEGVDIADRLLLQGPAGKIADDPPGGTFLNNAEPAYIAPMQLRNMTIDNYGFVSGMTDTGENVVLGQIAIANVPNANALENTSNGYYIAKANTGVITAEVPGEGSTGSLEPGRLEMANVDLAQEFTDMITTQRGFQANGRIITVTDEMLAELVNLKR